jgi:phosphohistidine phosphatase SixA
VTIRQLLLIRHAKAERHGEVDIERRLASGAERTPPRSVAGWPSTN